MCHPNADCMNFGGRYECNCKAGFKQEKVGDPVTGECVRKYQCFNSKVEIYKPAINSDI